MYGEEEEFEFDEEEAVDVPVVDDPLADEMKMEDDETLEDEIMDDEMELSRKSKSKSTKSKSKRVKGYANTSTVKADEEDSSFGEQQNSIDGNERSPAGEMGGNRADETFNAQFASALKDIAELKSVSKLSKVESIIPGTGNLRKGYTVERGEISEDEMSEDLESAARKMTFKQINQFRTERGGFAHLS